MTTQVSVQIVRLHMPVCVEVCREDGTIASVAVLKTPDAIFSDYVHSGQTFRVREMTTQEQFSLMQSS